MLLSLSALSQSRSKHFLPKRDFSGGSKFSRLFLPLFEHKKIKIIVGVFLAAATLFSSVMSSSASALPPKEDKLSTNISATIIDLTTKVGSRIPVMNSRITQGFSIFHPGIDFAAVKGEPVYPIMAGEIESIIYTRIGYGNHIIVNHGSNIKSLYAHLSKIEVSKGDTVTQDKIIGRVGSTGRSFGNHLHLEIYEDNKPVNPYLILSLK